MQTEIDAVDTALPITIIGINEDGFDSGNATITSGRQLPWLQPGSGDDIWTLWGVEYRDVYIVGPDNEHLGTFNLTVNDLADAANYESLKNQLLDAAGR